MRPSLPLLVWPAATAFFLVHLLAACGSETFDGPGAPDATASSGDGATESRPAPGDDGSATDTSDGGMPNDATADARHDGGTTNDAGALQLSNRLVTGYQATCALSSTGAVKCWGFNGQAVLGLGDTTNRGDDPNEMGTRLPTVALGTGRTASQVVLGKAHACALLDDGSVKCWGYNDVNAGQLGLGRADILGDQVGEMGDALPTVSLGTGRTAVQLAAGYMHTCALLDNGMVKCWGENDFGQLGLGDTSARGDGPGEMGDALPSVSLGTGRTAKQVTAGAQFSCALLDDETVKCWGNNNHGKLGIGDTQNRGTSPNQMGDSLQRANVGAGRTVKQLTSGAHHVCARLDDGTLKCWGNNQNGELGLGDTQKRGDGPGEMGDALPAVRLGAGRTVVDVRAGFSHTCARLDDGALKCWGYNFGGPLGLGDTNDRGTLTAHMGDALPAVALGTGRKATGFACGLDHTCALLDDGTLKCWGSNNSGQLGLGDKAGRGASANQMGDALPTVSF